MQEKLSMKPTTSTKSYLSKSCWIVLMTTRNVAKSQFWYLDSDTTNVTAAAAAANPGTCTLHSLAAFTWGAHNGNSHSPQPLFALCRTGKQIFAFNAGWVWDCAAEWIFNWLDSFCYIKDWFYSLKKDENCEILIRQCLCSTPMWWFFLFFFLW